MNSERGRTLHACALLIFVTGVSLSVILPHAGCPQYPTASAEAVAEAGVSGRNAMTCLEDVGFAIRFAVWIFFARSSVSMYRKKRAPQYAPDEPVQQPDGGFGNGSRPVAWPLSGGDPSPIRNCRSRVRRNAVEAENHGYSFGACARRRFMKNAVARERAFPPRLSRILPKHEDGAQAVGHPRSACCHRAAGSPRRFGAGRPPVIRPPCRSVGVPSGIILSPRCSRGCRGRLRIRRTSRP